MIAVQAKIQANARSVESLGTQRRGTGALIRDGYVLTIGYLVIEAEAIQVTGADGRTVPATVAGYDHASGFGAAASSSAPLAGKPLPLGDSVGARGARAGAGAPSRLQREGAERWSTSSRAGRSPAAGNTSSTRRSSPTRR